MVSGGRDETICLTESVSLKLAHYGTGICISRAFYRYCTGMQYIDGAAG